QLVFDEIPLEYLDWLSGQKWVYGMLRNRLTLYLNYPPVQLELDKLFPDKELESSGFEPSHAMRHKWHGQTIPKQPSEPKTKTAGQVWKEAWEEIADIIMKLDSMEDPNDFLDLDIPRIKDIIHTLKAHKQAIEHLRQAYIHCRKRMRETKAQPVGNIYRAI